MFYCLLSVVVLLHSILFCLRLDRKSQSLLLYLYISLFLFVIIWKKNYSTKLYQDAIKYEKLGTKNEKRMHNDNGKNVKKFSSDSSNRVNRRTGKGRRRKNKRQNTKIYVYLKTISLVCKKTCKYAMIQGYIQRL